MLKNDRRAVLEKTSGHSEVALGLRKCQSAAAIRLSPFKAEAIAQPTA
jgi:hypothetical protein